MEGNEEKKSFFNVIGMSDSFREFDKAVIPFIKAETKDKDMALRQIELQVSIWKVRSQLAAAQQLTVISESLKRILKLVVKEP